MSQGKRGFPFTGKIEHVTFHFHGAGAEPSIEERFEQAQRIA